MSDIICYDLELEGFEQELSSPNTAKTRYALNFKKIPYNTEWVTFSNIEDILKPITKSESRPTVPIIVDKRNGKVIQDSWEIAKYLEESFPETSLFNGEQGVHKFFHNYVEGHIMVPIFKMCILQIYERSGDYKDKFRQTREAMVGTSLEVIAGKPEDHVDDLKKAFAPIHDILKNYSFVSGSQAGWADIVLASWFTLPSKYRPDIFESHVLNIMGDDVFANWWKRTEFFRQQQ
ncbi:unnamed protein product [Rhizopus stolonifer]